MEWQPIQTAPKDGTNFIGYSSRRGVQICKIKPDTSSFKRVHAIMVGRGCTMHPTHWMPLPDPPKE